MAEAVATRRDRLGTTVGQQWLPNPVMPASGCFGPELASVMPVRRLAAVGAQTVGGLGVAAVAS